MEKMRKLIDLPEDVVKSLALLAVTKGISVKAYIERLVIEHIEMPQSRSLLDEALNALKRIMESRDTEQSMPVSGKRNDQRPRLDNY